MVSQKVLVRDKWRNAKKIGLVFGVVIGVLAVLGAMFMFGFFSGEKTEIILENPLKNIILANTNELGQINEQAVVEQGVMEFNEDYINYILVALGVSHLYKSMINFENPLIEFVLGDEVWSSEIIGGVPNSKKESIDNEDMKISISKEEVVEALLASNIEEFMKESVKNRNTEIELVAGKAELFSKGYLEMYRELTGDEGE